VHGRTIKPKPNNGATSREVNSFSVAESNLEKRPGLRKPSPSVGGICESLRAVGLRVVSKKMILMKKHCFEMLCWVSVGIFSIIRGIDESTDV
jgi:hypothetical protein